MERRGVLCLAGFTDYEHVVEGGVSDVACAWYYACSDASASERILGKEHPPMMKVHPNLMPQRLKPLSR